MPKQAPPESPADESQSSTPPPGDAPKAGAAHTHRFFTWVRSLGLVRQPGWIGGVSAGIADRLGIDVIVVRGILVVIAVLGGPAILLYALAWLVLPDAKNHIHLEDLVHGKVETPVVGIAVLVALSLLPVAQGFWWFGSLYWGSPNWGDSVGRAIWTLVILGLLVWFVVWFSRRASRGASTGTAEGFRQAQPTATPATPSTATAAQPATGAQPATVGQPEVAAGEPVQPAPLPADAPAEDVAAWRASQVQWKADHEAYRQQLFQQRREAAQAASRAAQAERAARAAAYRERYAATRSNPLYSVALVGVAFVAGAITTLALGSGTPTPVEWLVGTAVAVGVLGAGIIVNGAIGKRSGGASSVAVLLSIVLLVAAVVPQTQQRHYFGTLRVAPTFHSSLTQTTYLQGAGNVRLDLSSYYSTPRPSFSKHDGLQSYSQVNVLVVSGNVTVTLPADEYVHIDAGTAGGHITTATGQRVENAYNASLTVDGYRTDQHAIRELDVDIHSLHGNITFIQQGANQ
jgi:phage shock protein PspC (stress-responsive transcriptional regulator)